MNHEPDNPPLTHALGILDPLVHAPARLLILAHLSVLESADYVFMMRATNLTWGNLSSHLTKLEEAGYVQVEKTFSGKRPQTTLRLTPHGRKAYQDYKRDLQKILELLPD